MCTKGNGPGCLSDVFRLGKYTQSDQVQLVAIENVCVLMV